MISEQAAGLCAQCADCANRLWPYDIGVLLMLFVQLLMLYILKLNNEKDAIMLKLWRGVYERQQAGEGEPE